MGQNAAIAAHRHSSNHRQEIEASKVCGCFYCLAIFPPASIEEWCDDDTTALCPRCGIDSVIGDRSCYPIDAEFLGRMKSYWFSPSRSRGPGSESDPAVGRRDEEKKGPMTMENVEGMLPNGFHDGVLRRLSVD